MERLVEVTLEIDAELKEQAENRQKRSLQKME